LATLLNGSIKWGKCGWWGNVERGGKPSRF
jgi:hypothetical protein